MSAVRLRPRAPLAPSQASTWLRNCPENGGIPPFFRHPVPGSTGVIRLQPGPKSINLMVSAPQQSSGTIMPLTFTAINAAKPKDKPYKLADERGLYLMVMPTGGRLWRMNYRFDRKKHSLLEISPICLWQRPARSGISPAKRLRWDWILPRSVKRGSAKPELDGPRLSRSSAMNGWSGLR